MTTRKQTLMAQRGALLQGMESHRTGSAGGYLVPQGFRQRSSRR
jgi:hypothetical protein